MHASQSSRHMCNKAVLARWTALCNLIAATYLERTNAGHDSIALHGPGTQPYLNGVSSCGEDGGGHQICWHKTEDAAGLVTCPGSNSCIAVACLADWQVSQSVKVSSYYGIVRADRATHITVS